MMLGENEIARVMEIAETTARGLLEKKTATARERVECAAYSRRREILLDMLEVYRGDLSNSGRKFIDFLIERHGRAYEYHKQDDFYRVRHNLLVLRYLVSEPMEKRDICDRLNIKGHVYDRNLEKGIDELMVHAFGVDGLPPW
ncbi:MAG: hypothetical protein Q4B37_03580 [Eubacteriales bacterium]|nr:hypothetical protein [Eubacteriales bacterium]